MNDILVQRSVREQKALVKRMTARISDGSLKRELLRSEQVDLLDAQFGKGNW